MIERGQKAEFTFAPEYTEGLAALAARDTVQV
jgi:hypothetical protein